MIGANVALIKAEKSKAFYPFLAALVNLAEKDLAERGSLLVTIGNETGEGDDEYNGWWIVAGGYGGVRDGRNWKFENSTKQLSAATQNPTKDLSAARHSLTETTRMEGQDLRIDGAKSHQGESRPLSLQDLRFDEGKTALCVAEVGSSRTKSSESPRPGRQQSPQSPRQRHSPR
ncbi:MAG: hypothetical protein OHK93_000734 [Ramalina farinacea]|uniref:Uncharacterized protein n=1 Tax=Ramalina farinacea TaxID=258253 RepID=A0AA43TNL3_9LECA|nr:hypothetical protein [Ramalina farinacea]